MQDFPLPTLEQIREAQKRIAPYILETPFLAFDYLSTKLGKQIYLKCENLQKTGSFKIRGAANCILSQLDQAKKRGVIAASAGNHAQGVAAMAKYAGIPATIVMPEATPPIKIQNTQRWGAKVELKGSVVDEAFEHATQLSKEKGYLFVHPFLDPYVMAGQGTVALELSQTKAFAECEAIAISIGGGGLSLGIASALKALRPEIKIYGVTGANAPGIYKAFKSAECIEQPVRPTIAEGVATKRPDKNLVAHMKKLFTDVFSLPDESTVLGIAVLAEHGKIVAEGAGALPVAALLEKRIPEKNVCCLISGGNIDLPTLSAVLDWGLAEQSRLVRLHLNLPDRPGSLNSLTKILASKGANVVQVYHQRSNLKYQFGDTEIEVTLETRGKDHTDEIVKSLNAEGFTITTP